MKTFKLGIFKISFVRINKLLILITRVGNFNYGSSFDLSVFSITKIKNIIKEKSIFLVDYFSNRKIYLIVEGMDCDCVSFCYYTYCDNITKAKKYIKSEYDNADGRLEITRTTKLDYFENMRNSYKCDHILKAYENGKGGNVTIE
jgi:hypothetical protein